MKQKITFIASFCIIASSLLCNAQNISTIAGIGSSGYSGDAGLATSAALAQPQDVALDTFGNIYIADAANQRVRKITALTGVITTIAGTGTAGFSGDGGLATAAKLRSPIGIVVDKAGNVYIADNGNNCIRKVDVSTGNISTVAGMGGSSAGFSGDGGAATSATLYGPYDLAFDDVENLYIVDVSNQRIRKVTKSSGIINTVAGNGTAGFSGDGGLATSAKFNNPFSIAIDAANNLYITDAANHRIRKVTASTGRISTISGTGSAGFSGDGSAASSAQLNLPYSIAVDASNNIYISDFYNHRIRKITASTGVISTIAGTGTSGFSGDGGLATAAKLNFPKGIYVDKVTNIFIADEQNNRIRFICNAAKIPDPPVVSSPLILCTGSSPLPLTAIGSSLKWYSSASGGTGSTTAPTPSVASTGSTSYWVTQSSACGESARTELVVSVVLAPASPTVVSPVIYCQFDTSIALTASGSSTLNWYTSATGGTGTTTAPKPNTNSAGIISYYVSQGTSACQSPRVQLNVITNPRPTLPIVSDLRYCVGAASLPLTAMGTNLKWYSSASGGIGTTTAPSPSTTTEGTQTFYVSQSNSFACESGRVALSVNTNAKPTVSITSKTAPKFFVCKGATLSLKTIVAPYGIDYKWQLSGTDISSETNDSLVVSKDGIYSVIVSNAPNCNDTATVIVEQDSSIIKTSVSPTDVNICDGVGIKIFASADMSSGYKFQWLKDGIPLGGADTNATIIVSSKGNYQIVVTNTLGCVVTSNQSVVNTYPALAKPIISNSSGTLSIANSYFKYQWYRNNKLILGATNFFWTLSFDGDYYVTVEDKNGCTINSDTLSINNLSLKNISSSKRYSVFPNPSNDRINIEGLSHFSVQVYDVLGSVIYQAKDTENINISTWANSIYFLEIKDEFGQVIGQERIVKSSK